MRQRIADARLDGLQTPRDGTAMFTRVIIGIDELHGSRDAIAVAKAIAPNATLLLASVYAHPYAPEGHAHDRRGEALRESAQQMLSARRVSAGLTDAEIHVTPDTSAAAGLGRLAAELNADLMVLGAAHHGPVGRIVIGDVAHGVLNSAPCPVLIAPRGFAMSEPRFTRIGVAYDGSPESEHALALATQVTSDTQAHLLVVRVMDTAAAPEVWGVQVSEYLHGLCDPEQKRLDAVVAALPISARAEVLEGSPHAVLKDCAKRVDLIICGSRGWGPAGRLAFGSTAEHLMHHSPTPVLVVPRGAEVAAPADDLAEAGAQRAG
jgi:nucleotide-binding universal stress UspA family protein